jgi:hypothetical protein
MICDNKYSQYADRHTDMWQIDLYGGNHRHQWQTDDIKLTITLFPVGSIICLEIAIISNASLAIPRAWSLHASGSPLTAMYLSPTVSTCLKIKGFHY